MGSVSMSILVSNNEMVGFFFSDFGDLVNESSPDSKTWQNTELAYDTRKFKGGSGKLKWEVLNVEKILQHSFSLSEESRGIHFHYLNGFSKIKMNASIFSRHLDYNLFCDNDNESKREKLYNIPSYPR